MMMTNDDDPCPKCGEPLDYDEVHIGVGVQRGNYYCQSCGWAPEAIAIDVSDEERADD